MEPYFYLIFYIFFCYALTFVVENKSKRQDLFLTLVFVYMYLFCALRSFDVGRDIEGYMQMYEMTQRVSWDNWDYLYTENGYIFLMKICNLMALTNREFFMIVYVIILVPIFLFIRRFSVHPLLSLILWISFQQFVFALTGLRQAMGMSLCLGAFMASYKGGKTNFIIYLILVTIAVLIHKSAILFYPTWFIMRLKLNRRVVIVYAIVAFFCYMFNHTSVVGIFKLFESSYKFSTSDSYQLGLSLVMIILFAMVGLVTNVHLEKDSPIYKLNTYATNLLLASVCSMLLFNGSLLLRSSMYYMMFFVISIPIFIQTLDRGSRTVCSFILIAVMLFHFFTAELFSFDVLPYKLGEDINFTLQ